MRKIYNYILTICFILSATTCNAQVTVKLSQLAGTKWTIDYEEKVGTDTTLYLNSFTQFSAYLPLIKKRAKFRTPYYLTDSIPRTFDSSKVGKSQHGCYIVKYNDKIDVMTIFQIQEFDLKKGKMVLYNPRTKDAFRDGTIKYRLIK